MTYDELWEQLKTRLQAQLPWVKQVLADEDNVLVEGVDTPVLLLEDDNDDATVQQNGTGQLTTNMRWNARLVVADSASRREVRKGGIAVAAAIKNLNWLGAGCQPPMVMRIGSDDFRAPLKGYHVCLIEFEIECAFGVLETLGAPAPDWSAVEVVMRLGHEASHHPDGMWPSCGLLDVPMAEVKEDGP